MTGHAREGRQQTVRVVAITLSAFLLFALELYAGRVTLPVFGGSPAVWTTALFFFTAVVFLGYLYAHLLVTRLPWSTARMVHGAVVAAALAATVLAPAHLAALRFEGLPPAVNVVIALAAIGGAPAFVLSTTTPLLSARVARGGTDPWWLYAASNAASLAGLLAYPLVIEPRLPLSGQRVGVAVLFAIIAVAHLAVVASDRERTLEGAAAAPVGTAPSPRRQATWLFAASVPAGLLSAATMHLATDHVSSPLLWIGPLGVYLGSFVIAFSGRGRRIIPLAERLVPAAVTLMWVPFVARVAWPVFVIVPLILGCYAVIAIAVHGRLAMDRPAEEHLTRFYLLVSAGGLVATAFVALFAPLVFSDVYEYPILVLACPLALALLTPRVFGAAPTNARVALARAGVRLLPLAIAGALALVALGPGPRSELLFVALVLVVGAQAVLFGSSPGRLALGSAVSLLVMVVIFAPHPVARVRTFFGITEVRVAENGDAFSEIHGTTLHGLQFADDRRTEPTAYFVRSGPLGDVFADLGDRRPNGADIGVVGLGVGTIAAYARPNDTVAYFEIDQGVVDLARDARYFTYLADAPHAPVVTIGDGRLALEEVPPGRFDVLVLDAFSSDAVPAHLLTREAMQTYRDTLRPGGIIVFQLTNRHFDLVGSVASTAKSLGLDARTRTYEPAPIEAERLAAKPSTWLVVGSAHDVARFEAADWTAPGPGPVLTDDYSDVLRLLRWR